ncbi:MAG TPA: sugar ABC transporter permease [Planctomycetota bacterium]|nr:sugar ABC transporter permease [Planctomycetota bacterium]
MHQDDLIFTPPAKPHFDPWAYAFVAPAVLLLAVFLFYPMAWMLLASFQEHDAVTGAAVFSGVSAYVDQLHSARFWRAILNTIYFAGIYVPGSLAAGYVIAALINRSGRWRSWWRALFFVPVLLPVATAGLLWRWVYDPETGLARRLAEMAGMPAVDWLNEARLALPSIAVACIWQSAGLVAAIISSAMWVQPREYNDMAELDGVHGLARLIHVRLPMLKNALVVSMLLLMINAQRVFGMILLTTEDGGPANWSTNLPFLVYRHGMKEFNFSGASAIATLLCFSIVLLVVLVRRYPVEGREAG